MIILNLKPEHRQEYFRFETDVMYKVRIGVLSMFEAAKIIDAWLTERGY